MSGFSVYPQPVTASKLVGKVNQVGETLTEATLTSPSGGSANQYSAWFQVIASTGADLYVVGASLGVPYAFDNSFPRSPGDVLLDIGRGAAGAETTLATMIYEPQSWPAGQNQTSQVDCGKTLNIPLRVAAGQRIAARFRCSTQLTTSSFTGTLRLATVPFANVEGN